MKRPGTGINAGLRTCETMARATPPGNAMPALTRRNGALPAGPGVRDRAMDGSRLAQSAIRHRRPTIREGESRRLIWNPRVGGQETRAWGIVAEVPSRHRIPPRVFGRYVSKSAENGADVTVGRLHSALSAHAQAARRKRAGTVLVSYTHAGTGRASAAIRRSVGRSPPHAGGKQRGHDQNCQKPRGSAHFACRESPNTQYSRSGVLCRRNLGVSVG